MNKHFKNSRDYKIPLTNKRLTSGRWMDGRLVVGWMNVRMCDFQRETPPHLKTKLNNNNKKELQNQQKKHL